MRQKNHSAIEVTVGGKNAEPEKMLSEIKATKVKVKRRLKIDINEISH